KCALPITSNFSSKKQEKIPEKQPLLIAIGAVTKAMGIGVDITKIPEENKYHYQNRVEDIAEFANLRTRKVILVNDWWKRDNGPLLGFMQAENHPVALLIDKNKGNHYFLFDPELKTWTLVSEQIAINLAPEAYMFYRTLPSVVDKVTDVIKFGMTGFTKDLFSLINIGILGILLTIITPQATAILIDNVIPNGDEYLLLQLSLGLLTISFGRTFLNLSQNLITHRISLGSVSQIQAAIWDRLLKLKPSFAHQLSSGDLLLRVMSVSQIYSIINGAIQRTLLDSTLALFNMIIMCIYNIQLTIIGLIISLLIISATMIFSIILVNQERQLQNSIGNLQGLIVQILTGISQLRVAAAETRAFRAWAKSYNQQINLTNNINWINNVAYLFNQLMLPLSYLLIFSFWFLENQANIENQNNLTLGTFLAFNTAFGGFIAGVTSLSNTLTEIVNIIPLWQRAKTIFQEDLECQTSITESKTLQGSLRLQNISFRYHENGKLILNNVNIHAEPGEFIAIVGPSGSGKSTLFSLLLGFEKPLQGTILYDNQNLAMLNLSSVRRQLGVVLQNSTLMPGSIFDNITSGALVNMEQAWKAIRMAGLTTDIEAMPMGIHTLISDGGGNISGGQLQRLLIARALVCEPKIILMDEATSFLDNHAQAIVTESLDALNVTRIVVAHRLSTIRNADRIYVIEDGKIVQVGSFTKLIQQPGVFARLAARQLA
ncbi:MAG: NHLP bacteriocin export ABC transporter permease/ATPase subunit, partial [Sphaerospermopsis sp. SIO1G2]|nr:NHLP bacteriocin export ABC transporter permease/ATPase subunit [Sphaerospermopsis sp. SIO1G2]